MAISNLLKMSPTTEQAITEGISAHSKVLEIGSNIPEANLYQMLYSLRAYAAHQGLDFDFYSSWAHDSWVKESPK